MRDDKEGQICKLVATFDDDSKRFHRFIIDAGQEITGSIYVPKDSQGIPEFVNIRLRTKAQADVEADKE